MKTSIALFALLLTLPAAAAEPPPSRAVIPGVPSMPGPDPLVKALGRAIRIAADPAISDDYLYGVTGGAFLATVCSNNCNCRDYRDLAILLTPALAALGITVESFEGGDEGTWERIKASIADGVPVVAWNPFGDFEDSVITGYDEEKDRVYGWSTAAGDKAYAEGSIKDLRNGGLYGYLVARGLREGVDRTAVERAWLGMAVRMARRPPIEGG